jgi:6-phosphogluconate dehydrogenase (decarboxylating)
VRVMDGHFVPKLTMVPAIVESLRRVTHLPLEIHLMITDPAHVLSSALYERFSSRGEADFADKLLSAMRYEFGGHVEKSSK